MTANLFQYQKYRPWLGWVALGVFVLGLAVRIWHSGELPAGVTYELEAAYRMELGQCPYVDFCFDQVVPIAVWRMITLAVASLVAATTGAPTGLSDCFFNAGLLGMASVLTTSTLGIFSFALCWTIMNRFGGAVFADHIRSLILLAFALANLSMGFEYGEQQHLFVLLLLPYLLTRWLVLQGARVTPVVKLLSAVMASAGASFSILFLLTVLALEAVEALARRSLKSLAELSVVAFILLSAALWLHLLLLPKAAVNAFLGLILPLRINALTHDSYAFYGYFATPERRPLFYAMVLALIFAFGGLKGQGLFRPLAALTVCGLIVWMTLVYGLSADALILTFFTAMLLTMEGYLAAQWLTAKYPRLFWRKKELALLCLVLCGCLSSCAFLVGAEIDQRKLVKTGPTRLKSGENGSQDLAAVIKENTHRCAPVLIFNGRRRPSYPLLALCQRSSFGYFMGTDMLGTLSNIRTRRYFEPNLGLSQPRANLIEKGLYQRLLSDILSGRPELVCIQTGEMEDALKLYNIESAILPRYERLHDAHYYSDRVGPRELSECNYHYSVYKMKQPGAVK